ncbi:unnamed protein product [Paramecium sonneborni]|uniref:SH3 domain-containing protein n=1 Tax=Paramecium sonneborni TaxID=65129 RepID=A0A8S1QMW4_9CILI|nr:unnamed protein product [Paramecium sonneborni]
MYSLQKLVPNSKLQIKPGAFSQHQKLNQSVDGVLPVNQQSLQQLQTQIQILTKKEPIRQQNKKQELLQILENAQVNSKQTKSMSPKRTPQKQKSNRKLNFNQITDQDNLFLNSSNAMANMIIENILNKDEYYEKIKLENQELKDQSSKFQATIGDLKKKIITLERQNKEFNTNLSNERQNYQNELIKINEKIQSMKTMQQNLQMEQKKNELLTKQLQDQITINNGLKSFICENCLLSIEFLTFFQNSVQNFQPQLSNAYNILVSLSKHSTSFILDFISKTQNLNLPALRNCILPEEFDVNGFFETLEQLKMRESPELSFRNKNNNAVRQSIHANNNNNNNNNSNNNSNNNNNNNNNNINLSIPEIPKQNKITTLQEQFNAFLESNEPFSDSQLGSPYFTDLDTLDKQRPISKEKQRNQMPLQMNAAKRIKPEINQAPHYFQSFKQNDNEPTVFDSLMKEAPINKDRCSSVHSLRYLDQQIQKEQDKSTKRNKENQQINCQFVIAKYDYKAQKDIDLSFKKGDQIKLLKKTTNGWWYGEDKNQVKGYFPHNFVQLVG